MARYDFGGTLADFVVTSRHLGGLDVLGLSAATLTFWSAQSGGTRYTDLVLNGSAVTSISVGTDGQVPKFQGPDGVTEMWADGGAPRVRVVTLQGAPGPAGKDGINGANGLPGVNAVANDTATGGYVGTPGSATRTALDAAYTQLTSVATTATASATLTANRHTPVDATSAARTMTLPSAPVGALLSVEKTDASTNAVTVTGTMRGVASSSIPLAVQYDARTFLSEGGGSWRPVSDHRTTASLDARYTKKGDIVFNIKDYGAKLDGVTDDSAALQAVYDAANGAPIYVGPGRLALRTGLVGSKPLHIFGAGPNSTVIIRPAGIPNSIAFKISGSREATPRTVTANVVAGATTAAFDTTGISAGDYVLIRSAKLWPRTDKGATYGEIVRVRTVSAGSITTTEPIEESYATSDTAVAELLTMVDGISVRDLAIENMAPGTKDVEHAFFFQYATDVHAENVRLSKLDGVGFQQSNVVRFKGHHLFFDRLVDTSGGSGYGVNMADASRDFIVTDSVMNGGRHTFTTTGYGLGGTVSTGIPRRALVANCLAIGVTNAGFDSHFEGTKVHFQGCEVRGGQGFGIQLRALESVADDCSVDGSVGYGVWVRGDNCRVNVTVRNARTGVLPADGLTYPGQGLRVESVSGLEIVRANIANTDEDGVYVASGASVRGAGVLVDTAGRVANSYGLRVNGTAVVQLASLEVRNTSTGIVGNTTATVELAAFRSTGVTTRFSGGFIASLPKAAQKAALYYGAEVPASATTTMGVNTLKVCPLILDRAATVDRIGVEVTTAVAASTVRLGIYGDTGDGYPGQLILDAGTIDASTIGFKELTVSTALLPGLYWLAGVSQGGDPGLRVNTGTSRLVGVTAGATIQGVSYLVGSITGALPASFTTSVGTSGNGPRVLVRLA